MPLPRILQVAPANFAPLVLHAVPTETVLHIAPTEPKCTFPRSSLVLELHCQAMIVSSTRYWSMQALGTTLASDGMEACRRCCGGHGYSMLSGLPTLFASYVQNATWEGDNNVLYLQVCVHEPDS